MDKKFQSAREALEFYLTIGIRTEEGCLLWPRGTDNNGYGRVSVFGIPERIHILTWKILKGTIPVGMVICHTCDNPPCYEADHLFIGTQGDNIRDAIAKGRLVQPNR